MVAKTHLTVLRVALPHVTRCAAIRWWLLIPIALLAGVPHGHAQMSGHGGRGGNRQQPSAQQAPNPKPPAVLPEPWPRLDPGAVLCKSSEDLVLYQARLEGRPDAAAEGQERNCRVVTKRMPIRILDRDGPSRTHVVATDPSKQTGWTNAYLPAKKPSSANR